MVVNGSICLLVQYFAGPDVEPLSGSDCMHFLAHSRWGERKISRGFTQTWGHKPRPDNVPEHIIRTSAESILTLKNCESIHFGISSQMLSEKESIYDT